MIPQDLVTDIVIDAADHYASSWDYDWNNKGVNARFRCKIMTQTYVEKIHQIIKDVPEFQGCNQVLLDFLNIGKPAGESPFFEWQTPLKEIVTETRFVNVLLPKESIEEAKERFAPE